MSSAPPLIVSYAGVLGGAERVLLDCATRLDEPATVACPQGPLATAARAAGLEHAPLADRPLRIGAAHAGALVSLAREVDEVVQRRHPAAIVGWGARAVIACALVRRRPPLLAAHHDLIPRRAVRAAARWATRRADGVRRRLRGDRA